MSERRTAALGIGSILTLLLAILAWRHPPTGQHHSSLPVFAGHFHPLVVHLPIAMLLLAPVMDLTAALGGRPELRQAAGWVLGLAAAAALVAAYDGWLLAWSGGYKGGTVTLHMWGGIALAAMCIAAAWARGTQPVYWPLIVLAVGIMVWTSHQGGAILHGDYYFTRYMPSRLRSLLHLTWPPPSSKAAPAPIAASQKTAYGARIAPIFTRSCVHCHGPDKTEGGLMLDTYENLMAGGDGGSEIVPWQPRKSELVHRIKLPQDDDHAMPNDGKNLLTAEEIALIERWVAGGASDKEPAEALLQQ